jgi:hypothetical protein
VFRIIFHFLLATTLNAHILYKLKTPLGPRHPLLVAGNFIEKVADQMLAFSSAANWNTATQPATPAGQVVWHWLLV